MWWWPWNTSVAGTCCFVLTPSTTPWVCWPGEIPFSPLASTFVPCAPGAPQSPRGHGPEGLITGGWLSRLQKAGRAGCPGAGTCQRAQVPLQAGGERPDLCESVPGEVCSPRLTALLPFSSCQGNVLCLHTLVFPDRTPPAQAAQQGEAMLGSACPGIPCGGEPDGQHCLAELPPSSLPSRSRSCLGRCPRPALLPGPSPVRFRAPAGRLPCHCPVPFRSSSAWT